MKILIVRFISFLLFFMTLWLESGWLVLQCNGLAADAEATTIVSVVTPPNGAEGCEPIDMFYVLSRKNTEKRISEMIGLRAVKQSIVRRFEIDGNSGLLSLTQLENQYTALLAVWYDRGYRLYSQSRLMI